VLYAPDFVVNAGGLINIAEELAPGGYHPELAAVAVRRIFDTVTSVLQAAETERVTTAEAADRRAEERIAALSAVHQIRIPT
jgi:glutamate dehydrogenase/leucine dehydrogenase